MRVLVLTNFYPPHELGGQGKSCQQVVEGLKRRGHETLVVTSTHGAGSAAAAEDGVLRSLYLEMDLTPLKHGVTFFTRRKQREAHNLRELDRVIDHFRPDVVFVWGMWNIPRSTPVFVERKRPGRVAYRFAEYWPLLPSQHENYWKAPGLHWATRLPKWFLSRIALAMLARERRQYELKFEHAMCVSASTRQVLVEGGVPVAHARVIHTGLDIGPFEKVRSEKKPAQNGSLRVLYAGRLAVEKGIETALEAMIHLVRDQGRKEIYFDLAGSGEARYLNQLKAEVSQRGVGPFVTFLGRVPTAEMPALMQSYDVLLVPSIWPEPFARVVLEGMVSSLVVIAAPTGGTKEIVVHEENGLLFPAGDSRALADRIAQMADDPALRQKLAEAGRRTVLEGFTEERMMDEIEAFLLEIAGETSPPVRRIEA